MRTAASAALTCVSNPGAAAALPSTTYSMNPRPLTEKNLWQPTWLGNCVRSAAGEKSCSFNGQGTVGVLANSGVAADSPLFSGSNAIDETEALLVAPQVVAARQRRRLRAGGGGGGA